MSAHTANPQPYSSYHATVKPRRGFAVTALVLGIIAAVFGFVPLTSVIAIPCGILAVIFGLLGRKHGLGKAGFILGVVGLALGIWGAIIVNQTVDKFNNDMQHIDTGSSAFKACMDKAITPDQMAAC